MEWIWLVVLFSLGVMMLAKPELLWKVEHMFTVRGGEPTDVYLTCMRIGGLFFTIAAVVCAISALL